ncbi:MAG: ATPase [Candidatus Methanoperedenaceae archaeon]|nr:MAG: ATPase [Candidatus Methanoperedenaceae archaeon]
MTIKKIKISNFKSFKNQEVELGKFNILIGANASGKSSFIQVFRFIRDIANHGLDNAISMQGGVEFLRNVNISSSENFSLEFISDEEYKRVATRTKEMGLLGVKIYNTSYKFSLKFKKKGSGFEIIEDQLSQKFYVIKFERKKKKTEEKERIGEGEIRLSNVKGKINISLDLPEKVPLKKEDIIPSFLKEERLTPRNILLEPPFPFFLMPPLFGEIAIYDFDPKLPKKATPITGKAELEEDGSNLSIILKNIIETKNKERELSNFVRDLLPFVDDLDVEKFADKSLLFKLREIYSKKQYLPASLISDGTINITALIIAIYFERKRLTIIEEPERNIHPYLISKIVNMMKDASQKKQIIVTTHNPEVVKHASLEDILLVTRDKEGFSNICRPTEKTEIKTFLENEIGIEELYVQNLLGL